MITHVAIFWTDDSSEKRLAKFQAAAKELADVSGVKRFRCGRVVSFAGKSVDESFALAVALDFKSSKQLGKYLADPAHTRFVEEQGRAGVKRSVAYNFGKDKKKKKDKDQDKKKDSGKAKDKASAAADKDKGED
jgi:hypothetical protein